MKILMTTQPAIGHLHPMLPVAEALKALGHEVAFASSRSFRKTIEAEGFHCFEVGLDWLESEAPATFPELLQMPPERATYWYLQELFAKRAMRAMLPDVIDVARKWKPDVVVRGTWEFSGCVAAEYLELPHASISASLYFGIWQGLIAEQLEEVRREHGLARGEGQAMLERYLYLDFVPPSLHFPELERSPVVHSLRLGSSDRRKGDEGRGGWFEGLPEQPTVYVTLGTVFNRVPGVFEAILAGLREEPVNVIVTVGRNQDPAAFGPQPSNVRIERYIPQEELLPRCDVVVTHGGFNTVLAALGQGKPVVATPLGADQPQNSLRVWRSGCGLVLPVHPGVAQLPRSEELASCPLLSPQTLREAVREVLGEPRYRQAAERMRLEAEALPGPERAAELLVQLAAERKPVLSR
ncbi:MAG TPA: glycosyltransferase [Myxococcaceae bacterium]|nr:glycosyltransferase [Myxococcaceae bacterium]